ncbi:MAG: hypothetical protein VKP62_04380 [Candidatus Sericytochromatia bacterium]|nr:hypothetical protein [Candidatus Sericytochromatia bacterium]
MSGNATYGHPKLNELLQQAAQTPFIGQVLIQTLRDLVHPQDRILACYPIIETSGQTADREFTYYSVDVVLVTTAFFIRINFYPKTHLAIKKRIHLINELKFEYPAPPMDELAGIKGADYVPNRVKLEVQFNNDRGALAEHWTAEASDEHRVRDLMDINRLLGRMVGMPLAQAVAAAAPQAPAPSAAQAG